MQSTWKIESLERKATTGQVVTAHWRVIVEHSDMTETAYGTVTLDEKDPSDPEFVPFDQLTEPVVVEWVKQKLDVQQIEQALTTAIELRLNPPTVVGTPW